MNNLDRQLKDLVAENTILVDFFNDEGIDYCCGGADTLGKALEDKKKETKPFLERMDVFIEKAKEERKEKGELNVYDMKIDELIDHLEKTHHVEERAYLKQVDEDLNKILIVNFEHHGELLLKLHSLFADLKKELEEHFVKEEKITFPMILKDYKDGNITKETLKKVEELEEDHEGAGAVIKEMIDLTDHFEVPEDACFTYNRTFETLHTLVEDVFIHIFKENSILFEKLKGEANEKTSQE